jgi:hypothetical protein
VSQQVTLPVQNNATTNYTYDTKVSQRIRHTVKKYHNKLNNQHKMRHEKKQNLKDIKPISDAITVLSPTNIDLLAWKQLKYFVWTEMESADT